MTKNRGLRGSGYLIGENGSLSPEGGNGAGDFVLEDFDEFFAFRLTIGSALYKYMRICLWTAVWQRCYAV